MKLALVLLLLAGALIWFSARVEDIELPGASAAPRNSTPPEVTTAPTIDAAPPHQPAASGFLFRAAQTPSALQQPRPGEIFTLQGMVGDAETRLAFLRDESDHQTLTARVGAHVGSWTVAETSERCVVLRRERQRRELCVP